MKRKLSQLLSSVLFWVSLLFATGELQKILEKLKEKPAGTVRTDDAEFAACDGKEILSFTIHNDTANEVTYNTQASLYVLREEDFIPVALKEHPAYSGASYYLEPGDEQRYAVTLTDYYDPLSAGIYRYVKTVGNTAVDVDFSVTKKRKK
ncbi:MAG: hypothetical protein IJ766_02435 [Clostridia bacterium]|nr:hypothetical protein [Clostridia bacterium]